ncbi:MATE efflux family protein, putative [Medicago truncatula]|uniref:MATE efflux family protein, putative n=1 Tax=Medicago truncatula TaxID=3880 RepID=G7J4D8_MEDTR|nr:MATE efflux family protein, putative [Medicago truncatula]
MDSKAMSKVIVFRKYKCCLITAERAGYEKYLGGLWINLCRERVMIEGVSMEAGKYAKLVILCLFAYGLIQCLNKFLQVQNTILPTILILMVVVSLCFPICWIIVHKLRLGKRGVTIENCVLY